MDRKVVNSHFEKGYLYLVFDDGSVVWVAPDATYYQGLRCCVDPVDISELLDGDTEPEDFGP